MNLLNQKSTHPNPSLEKEGLKKHFMNKLFKKISKNKSLLMTHVVIGYPSIDETVKTVETMANAGVDIIELQMPFSDPVADGPTIMHANDESLKNGTTTKDCLKIMGILSKKVDIPLLFMGYFNTIFNYGVEKFCEDSAKAGCQGLIVPDMPIDEEKYENFYKSARKNNLAVILVVSPLTNDKRLKDMKKYAQGFIYAMARTGITGKNTEFKNDFSKYIGRVKKIINLPIAVGFGIKEKSQVDFAHKYAEIAVIGSKLIEIYKDTKLNKFAAISKFIKSLQ